MTDSLLPSGSSPGSTSEIPSERVRTAHLTVDDRHRLLANERRRATLEVLSARPLPVGLERLATAVAARESGDQPAADEVRRVSIALHHRHLPKLADTGVIYYDSYGRRVE